MPVFHMPVADHAKWNELDTFTQGFIEAMFFSETSCFDVSEWFDPATQHAIAEGQSDGNIPKDCDSSHIHPDALKSIADFCAKFQASAADLLALAYARDYDEAQAGRDLYFSHCGAGVGFWSRDVLEPEGLGEKLSEASGRGEVNPFFGDHVDHGNAPFIHVSIY
jgi:hypothetical protein